MYYNIILLIVTLIVTSCRAQNTGQCEISENGNPIDYILINDEILDTGGANVILRTFTYIPPLNITNISGEGATFIDVDVDVDLTQIVFKTNANFDRFDELTAKQSNPSISLDLRIGLNCQFGVSSWTFLQAVRDSNGHAPTFTTNTYTYEMPQPLVPRIDLTSLGPEIIVEDLDFSNTDVTFTIDSPIDFTLETQSRSDSKQYRGVLRVKEFTWLPQNTSLTITATDNGDPTLSSSAEIFITRDEANIIPDAPTFEEASYWFDYSVVDNKPSLTPKGGKPIVHTNDPEDINVTLQANEYFDPIYDPGTKTVEIVPNGALIVTSKTVMDLSLTATLNGDSGKTIILIDIPDENVLTVPTFSQPYYVAHYSTQTDPHTVTLDGDISVSENEDVDITLSGDPHFTLTKNDITSKWDLILGSNLSDDDLQKGDDIILILHATVKASAPVKEGLGTLIIKLPEVIAPEVIPPKFSNPYYEATYKVDETGKATVELAEPIDITANGEAVDVTIDRNSIYAQYFSLQRNPDDEKNWLVSVAFNLPSDLDKREIILVLEGTTTSGTDASALVISLPETAAFNKPYYTATYTVDSNGGLDSVTVDEPIQISVGNGDVLVTVTGDYSQNFGAAYNSSTQTWQIEVKINLPPEVLDSEADILLTLSASVFGISGEGLSTLLINLPKKTVPASFDKAYYSATYAIDNTGTPNFTLTDGPIQLVGNNVDKTTVTLTGDNAKNFKLSESNPYSITLEDYLDIDIVDNNSEIVLTLEAKLDDSPATQTAPVIISLPSRPAAPTFSEPLYTATYDADTATVNRSTGHLITTDPSDPKSVTVTVQAPYNQNFELTYDDSEKAYEIRTITPLDNDTVINEPELYVILNAAIFRAVNDGTATLVVKMPQNPLDVIPTFSKNLYTGRYENATGGDSDTVTVLDLNGIIITSDHSKETEVAVKEPDDAYFKAEGTNDGWKITVIKNLDETTLRSEKQIIVTLVATLPGNSKIGFASLLIDLPAQDLKRAPQFKNTYYTAAYKGDSESATIEITGDAIAIRDPDSELTTVVFEDYQENFGPIYDPTNSVWNIQLIKPLDENILKDNTDLAIRLLGTLEGSVADAAATLLVKLPVKETDVVTFSENYYRASYIYNGTGADSIEIVPEISISDTDSTVTLSGEYSDYFKIDCAGTTCTLSVVQDLPLHSLTSQSEILLVLEASKEGRTGGGKSVIIVALPVEDSTTSIHFKEAVYVTTYRIGSTTLEFQDEQISISGFNPDNVTLEIEGDNSKYFNISLTWQLTSERLPEELVNDEVSIVLTLKASAAGFSSGVAGLIVNLPKKEASSTFIFDNPVYTAEYATDSTNVTIQKEITLNGDPDVNATLSITGDFADHFNVDYKDGKAVVTLTKPFSDEILQANSVVSITIVASKGTDPLASTSTVVVVHLPKSGNIDTPAPSKDDQTGLIAAVAVLAVLLVAALVGSAVFYYLKFRRGQNNFSAREEPRFTKSNNPDTRSKIEHPTRRPTGLIKYEMEKEDIGETVVDEETVDGRKSVQFDVDNIDEMVIEPETEDVDDADVSTNIEDNDNGGDSEELKANEDLTKNKDTQDSRSIESDT